MVFAGISDDAPKTVPVNSELGEYFVNPEVGLQSYNVYLQNNRMGNIMEDAFHETQHAFMFASGQFRGSTKTSNPFIGEVHHGAMMQSSLWGDHARFIGEANRRFKAKININMVWLNSLWNRVNDPRIYNKVLNKKKIRY